MLAFQNMQPRATSLVQDASPALPSSRASHDVSPTMALLMVAFVVTLLFVAKLVFSKKEHAAAEMSASGQPVIVMDVQMHFSSMVAFMVKWAIASIPAVVILCVIGALLVPAMGAMIGALAH